MAYRLESSIHVPYGRVVIRRDSEPTISPTNKNALWKSNNTTTLWLVSNCVNHIRREQFVAELGQYVDVDACGSCSLYKCAKSRGSACYKHFERAYFFRLAFENSICADYATEKLSNALKYAIVTVGLGGTNYSQIARRG
ncbi:hypothetical protein HPB49_010815 [Dermacentor silvarum]|uniref:Uncharacterized protein n=1 Tax=Dermacentor silvarum TaxID=543639 RepID=A0ACB8CEI7_DERSI|nr:hypothetical protein HPB49_010815 [Dermacentor silvarum]